MQFLFGMNALVYPPSQLCLCMSYETALEAGPNTPSFAKSSLVIALFLKANYNNYMIDHFIH